MTGFSSKKKILYRKRVSLFPFNIIGTWFLQKRVVLRFTSHTGCFPIILQIRLQYPNSSGIIVGIVVQNTLNMLLAENTCVLAEYLPDKASPSDNRKELYPCGVYLYRTRHKLSLTVKVRLRRTRNVPRHFLHLWRRLPRFSWSTDLKKLL